MADDPASAFSPEDAPADGYFPPHFPPETPLLRIIGDIHRRFCRLPDETRTRAEQESAEKKQRYNRFMSGYMSGTYWKKNERLSVSFKPPEWEVLTRFAQKSDLSRTAAFREAAFRHIEHSEQDDGPAPARRPAALHPQDPALQERLEELFRRISRVENAIDRIGININQAVRHIHTNKTATLSEIRACHRLLDDLKKEVLDALTVDLPPANTQ